MVGGVEIVLAIVVLVAPLPSLLLGICLWKMGTETLFMTSGSLPFEWIERAGSYMAPWALYYLVAMPNGARLPSASPHLTPPGRTQAPMAPASPARSDSGVD